LSPIFPQLAAVSAGLALAIAVLAFDLSEADHHLDAHAHAAALKLAPEIPGEPLQPLPAPRAENPLKVELGRLLFHDARLSGTGDLSCASCHRPDHGGADDVALSLGATGEPVPIHTPTVWNSRFNVAQFWDAGRSRWRRRSTGRF
jgi:cytochrome c peroxidase